jgi:Cu(I)/Ag(I) efflux system membrane protein CusA/SilA
MLMMAVQQAGRDVGAMSVEQSGIETMIRGAGFIRSVRDVEDIVLRGNAAKGAGVRLGDLAEVHLGGQFRQGLLADAHQEQVGAWVGMRVREDPQTVIRAVKQRLRDLAPALAREQLAGGSVLRPLAADWRNHRHPHGDAAGGHLDHGACGGGFLLHVRASLAVAASLPLGHAHHLPGHAPVRDRREHHEPGRHRDRHRRDGGLRHHHDREHHAAPGGPAGALPAREGARCRRSPFDPEITDTVVRAAQEVARPLLHLRRHDHRSDSSRSSR